MILELVGLPGSGKSTFARSLESDKKWTRVRITKRGELLYYATYFFLRHPVSTARQLSFLIRYRGNRALWYTKFINLFLVHNAKYMKASRLAHAIIDQGHLQNAMSLFDTEVEDEVLFSYIAILPHPDMVVFFDVSEAVRMQRIAGRGYGVREHFSPELRAQWGESSARHFARLFARRASLECTAIVLREGEEEALCLRLSALRLVRFVMHLRMPTEKAHGVQIAKTLEALSHAGEFVELWIPKRKNLITENLFAYYGLTATFPIRTIHSVEILKYVGVLKSIAYWLDALTFLCALLIERVDTQSLYYTRSAPVAWLLKNKGARVYFEAHAWPASKASVLAYLLRRIDGVAANSHGTAQEFVTRGFRGVEIIRNGVDLERFESTLTHAEARKQVRLPENGKIIMYVGSFARWKGVATLCGAWKKIQKQFPDTALVFVGGTVAQLEGFPECHDIRADESVIVLGHQSSNLVPAYLRSANVLVLPNEPINNESVHYTSPIKLFEYMASGRPIIASDLPSIREILDETTATFFSAGDVTNLSQKLSAILSNNIEALARAEHASALVEVYGWAKRAKSIIAMLGNK